MLKETYIANYHKYTHEGVIDTIKVRSETVTNVIRLEVLPHDSLAMSGMSLMICKQDLPALIEIFTDILGENK
jgi:hypothetical protein